jgi:ABC-2 type transport system permease protein
MSTLSFSWRRLIGLVKKEFIQLKRDRMTFAMLIGLPFMQLLLFGFAINADPKAMPTVVVQAEESVFARSYVKSLENTGYFKFTHTVSKYIEADTLLRRGEVLFIVTIPADFSRRLVRGERPSILIEADATDPIAAGSALNAAREAHNQAFKHDLGGVLSELAPRAGPAELRVHRRYNPENITQYNTVPGLIGIILTMTLVMITSGALARERERGTLESLYSMPLMPIEVMLGKIIPFVIGASVQTIFVLLAAKLIFHVPMLGSFGLLAFGLVLFVTVNLAIGFTFSTIAKTQLQAVQMSTFFFMPSILLSGFMFPFKGMPLWAQYIGEILPTTHFLRLIRGILLKDMSFTIAWGHIWPMLIILSVVSFVALKRYQATLD